MISIELSPQAHDAGVKLFIKNFKGGGFFHFLKDSPVRSREGTLGVIVGSNLAKDRDSAEKVLADLVDKEVHYGEYNIMSVHEVKNKTREPHYRLGFYHPYWA